MSLQKELAKGASFHTQTHTRLFANHILHLYAVLYSFHNACAHAPRTFCIKVMFILLLNAPFYASALLMLWNLLTTLELSSQTNVQNVVFFLKPCQFLHKYLNLCLAADKIPFEIMIKKSEAFLKEFQNSCTFRHAAAGSCVA